MPEKTFKIEIVTPERIVVSMDNAVSLVVPAAEGSLGVMANHAPLMASLEIGELDIRSSTNELTSIAISGGFMEVRDNLVRVLVSTAELADEIDIPRAEDALRRAQERLRSHSPDIDHARAEAALKRALARLQVARGR